MSSVADAKSRIRSGAASHAWVVVDHGSRRAEANRQIDALRDALQAYLDAKDAAVTVYGAHMELADPSLADVLVEVAESGVREVTVVPHMLGPGRHATEDIPRIIRETLAARALPLAIRYAAPLGIHELLVRLIEHRAAEARPLPPLSPAA